MKELNQRYPFFQNDEARVGSTTNQPPVIAKGKIVPAGGAGRKGWLTSLGALRCDATMGGRRWRLVRCLGAWWAPCLTCAGGALPVVGAMSDVIRRAEGADVCVYGGVVGCGAG